MKCLALRPFTFTFSKGATILTSQSYLSGPMPLIETKGFVRNLGVTLTDFALRRLARVGVLQQ